MKKILKIVLTVAFVAGSTSVFAQKLGRINMQELVFAMPETAEMQKNLEAYQKELQDQLETIGVEFNNKLNEYTKQVSDKNSTMSDSVRQLKEKELNDLKTRYDEFVQVSQQDMQKKQGELLEPIIVKAQDAVKEAVMLVEGKHGFRTHFEIWRNCELIITIGHNMETTSIEIRPPEGTNIKRRANWYNGYTYFCNGAFWANRDRTKAILI